MLLCSSWHFIKWKSVQIAIACRRFTAASPKVFRELIALPDGDGNSVLNGQKHQYLINIIDQCEGRGAVAFHGFAADF